MRSLIETIRRGDVSEKRDIDTEQLSLGCGPDQDIRLQSRLAGLSHAVIEQKDVGGLQLRAFPPNTFVHNGQKLVQAALAPGDEFSIGNICFTVEEAPEAYDLHLTVKIPAGRSSKELEDALLASCHPDAGLSGFSMRRAAWGISLAIITLFFLLPLAGFVYKPLGIWLRTVPIVSDLSWNSGPISSAHSFFAADCNRCHQQAFVSVQNAACTDCHKDTPHHFAEGLRNVEALKTNRCASCHQEHSGSEVLALAIHDDALCASCHKNIRAIAPDSKLANVSDFGHNHPEFRATLAGFAGDGSTARIALDQKIKLQEYASLEFSHAAHLNKAGIKSPGRGKVLLDCANCHQPDPGGKYMTLPNFESQCHECHRLNFEADDPKHELPHGDNQAIQKYLEGYYANRALKGSYRHLSEQQAKPDRLRPGEATARPEAHLETEQWVNQYAHAVDDEVMRFRVCGKCHLIKPNLQHNAQQPWMIEPLNFDAHKFPKADFDHGKHKTQDCRSCHDAEQSKLSNDVLLKGIASCQACHGGAGAKNKVDSLCVDCHGFHTSRSLTMEGKKLQLPAKAASVPGVHPPPALNNTENPRSVAP